MSNILQELRCVFRNEDPIDVSFSLRFLSKFSLMAHASWIQSIKNDTEIQSTCRLDFGMDDVHSFSHSSPVQINRGHQFLQEFYPNSIKDSASIREAIIEKSREIQYIGEHGLKNGTLKNLKIW